MKPSDRSMAAPVLAAALGLCCVALAAVGASGCGQRPADGATSGPATTAAATAAPSCSVTAAAYKPMPAYSGGKRPALPEVPILPPPATKEGDAYTVRGARHDLRSLVHERDFDGRSVTVVGYIVDTTLERLCADELRPAPAERCTPKCALHPTSKPSPEGCESAEPTFWLADAPSDDPAKGIPVVGWASNAAVVYDLVTAIGNEADGAKQDAIAIEDPFLGAKLPNPVPARGARVKVTGSFGFNYNGVRGAIAGPAGILGAKSLEYLQKPEPRATLPKAPTP